MTPKFDVNLSMLFTELSLLERPGAASACGFDAAEMWWPFEGPTPSDRELNALQQSLADAALRLVLLNFDAGDMASGQRGLLSLPDQSSRFRANIEVAVGLAETTGCKILNALYGNREEGVGAQAQDELATENLALAADAAARIGAVVTVEALNSDESPLYPLTSSVEALGVVDRLRTGGIPNIGFLADLYHLSRMGEDPVEFVKTHVGRFDHVQIADAPGRHQPGTGDIPFERVFETLVETGYRGYVGLEYRPVGPSTESFKWWPLDKAGERSTS